MRSLHKIKVLIENKSSDSSFKAEHGLSLYIETGTKKILVDTGMTDAFLYNAEKMGVKIEDIDNVIASHSHNDHTGGLPTFFSRNDHATLYISKNANKKLYFKIAPGIRENVSTPEAVFSLYRDRIFPVDKFLKIDDSLALVSGFKRTYPIPSTNNRLLEYRNNTYQKDNFDHEIAVVINNNGKLVIITGCSHSGVDNMIEEVMKHFPGYPLQAVIGGFHLMSFLLPKYLGENKTNIIHLGEKLLNYNIEQTYTCHCTGDRGYKILKSVMGDKISYFKTGDELEL